jgi:folate-binding protein YgfZ
MNPLMLHEFHHGLNARFTELNGTEIVTDYGDWLAEHAALHENAGVIDLSFRSRICLIGNDRVRFLHGQVTNDMKKLRVGEGCYAAITTNKGKMESDLSIFRLADELLLDFEPGLTQKISQRLEKFIVADDVQIVDTAPHYGLLSVQGQKSEEVICALNLFSKIPTKQFGSVKISDATLGEIYLANNSRLGTNGFDLFVPNNSLGAVADKLVAGTKQIGGRAIGWQAFETARIEAGIPRFGADMDETNIPLECGIESRAVSYNKGCYIGQEVINRIHSVGHVTRELRGLRLANDLKSLPQKHDKLFHAGKEVGYVTSAVKSPSLNALVSPKLLGEGANIALGYVRREANQIGNELTLQGTGESPAKIVALPFVK